jgi:hypothetical protein
MKGSATLLAALLFAVAAVPTFAEDFGESLRACRSQSDDARRLACYDRVASRAESEAPAAAVANAGGAAAASKPAPPAAVPAAAPTPEDNFGRERTMAAEEDKRRAVESHSIGGLSALVVGIDTRGDGLMTITLDNGQVWRQNAPDSKFRLQEGDKIRIQPGSLNSFILSGPSNRSTRVTRVK